MGTLIITTIIALIAGILLGFALQNSKIANAVAAQNDSAREAAQLKTQIESEKIQRDQAVDAEKSKAAAEISALQNSAANERTNLIESYEREKAALAENHNKQIATLKSSYDAQINAQTASSQKSIEELKTSYSKQENDLKANSASEKATIIDNYEKQIAALKSAHATEISAMQKTEAEQKTAYEKQTAAAKGNADSEKSTITENYEKQIAALKESNSKQIEAMQKAADELKLNFQKTREEYEKQMSDRLAQMKTEFQALAQEVLEAKSGNLQTANRDLIKSILNPLSNNIKEFKESFDKNKVATTETQVKFEDAIKQMKEETVKIGTDAVNLTKALKGNSKNQGDWGEMVLETMLENSGLVKGENYLVQENFKTEDGRNKRPDVIVKFPNGRNIVIDSKVSLIDYAKSVEAATDEERDECLKRHVASVRKHIDELADREDYLGTVPDSMGVVLMFIPNEASYIAAIKTDQSLHDYAIKKHILLISPSNLLLTLHLAYDEWRTEKQNQNVQEIIKKAEEMYDKFVSFTDSFKKIGDNLDRARSAYDDGFKQLSSGRGNLVTKMDNVRKLGLNPKKQPDRLFLTGNDD